MCGLYHIWASAGGVECLFLEVLFLMCYFCVVKVKRIFVGGLSSDSSEEDLRDYFETFGKVSILFSLSLSLVCSLSPPPPLSSSSFHFLSSPTSYENFSHHFSRKFRCFLFPQVVESQLMYDRNTNRHRGGLCGKQHVAICDFNLKKITHTRWR